MVTILIIGGILLLLLSSNSSRYHTRYDNYEPNYLPPPPASYYPMPMHVPQYDPSQAYYRYESERNRQALGYTAIFVALLIAALFVFGGAPSSQTATQDTRITAQTPPRYR